MRWSIIALLDTKNLGFPEASPFTNMSERQTMPSVSVLTGRELSAGLNTDSSWGARDREEKPEPQRRVMAQDSFGKSAQLKLGSFRLRTSTRVGRQGGAGGGGGGRGGAGPQLTHSFAHSFIPYNVKNVCSEVRLLCIQILALPLESSTNPGG